MIIKGYFHKCDDKYKKLTMIFNNDEFTKSLLMRHYSEYHRNPVDNNEFYVKYDPIKTHAFLDKNNSVFTPIQALIDRHVEMTINIKHYSFVDNKSGKKIIGWNINLINIRPISE
ncbi:MAG: hypothetical protein ACRCZI_07390 [Cetobacterium sp.]